MQKVEKAVDAIDKIARGRKARGGEYHYEGLRRIMGAEMAEPKGVKKAGRRMLVAAVHVAGVQLAASSFRTGWVAGTRGQREKDEGVWEEKKRTHSYESRHLVTSALCEILVQRESVGGTVSYTGCARAMVRTRPSLHLFPMCFAEIIANSLA